MCCFLIAELSFGRTDNLIRLVPPTDDQNNVIPPGGRNNRLDGFSPIRFYMDLLSFVQVGKSEQIIPNNSLRLFGMRIIAGHKDIITGRIFIIRTVLHPTEDENRFE
jgi:hypothetical protein